MSTNTSPFKFLDAYTKEDKDIFFGREDEVEQLYDLVWQSHLTLVYGQSGTGKTSLVKCGLANRFFESDWFDLHVRRSENINISLRRNLKRYEIVERPEQGTLKERLMRKRQDVVRTRRTEQEADNEIIRLLRHIYKHYLKPIFLIFDQFEELYILGNREEQHAFYQTIAEILDSENYCRVIIIMREESIAQLYDFERVVPSLFDKRLRVEPMSRFKTKEVISRTAEKFAIGMGDDKVEDEIINL
ncbi:MAG: ATP-binding protein, partial [Lewinella sp.]|nr:ATP-binding protein [Lewinella sp.]